MSKKSRSNAPGEIGSPGTVVDGATVRLDNSGRADSDASTREPDGTLVSRLDGLADTAPRGRDDDQDDAPTAMIDLDALKASTKATEAPRQPMRAESPRPAGHSPVHSNASAENSPSKAKSPPLPPSDAAYPSTGVLGLDVVMRWSGEMHKARFFPTPSPVTIGEEGLFALPDDVMGGKKLDVLVEPDAKEQFALSLANPAIKGQIIIGPDVYAIADVKAGRTPLDKNKIQLTAKTHAFLEFGDFTFVLSRGAVPPPAKPSLWSSEDSLLVLMFAIAAVLLLGPLFASFALTDPRDRRAKTYLEELEQRVVEIQVIEDKKEEEKKPEDEKKDEEEKKDEKPTAPVESPVKVEQVKIEKAADEIKNELDKAAPDERDKIREQIVTREVDKATAAVDAALNDLPTTKLAPDLGTGADAAAAAGEAGAGAVVLDTGSGPSDPGRRGPSVGGTGDTGKQVATGLEKQNAGGVGPKLNAEVKAKDQKVVRVVGPSAGAEGELPPDVIKKYLSDKAGAIKSCYQKELQSNPDLSGSIKVKFVINPAGQVVGVKVENSSLDSDKVQECITTLIKSLRFPQAKGGGITTVNKTFTFKSN